MREFDMHAEDDGKPAQRLKPSWRDNAKDFLLIAGAAAAVAGWIYGHAKTWVESADYQRYQEERKLQDRFTEDRMRTIENKVNDTAAEVKVIHAETVNTSKAVDRIENKLDDRHRR